MTPDPRNTENETIAFQPVDEDEAQEENAATSLDQPSEGSS